jgi:uncharacterized membrane protein YdbT with pleckstrin-like domain
MSEKVEKQFPGQHEGEEVELLFRQHPLVMRKALVLGLLAILVAVLPLDFPQVYSSDKLAGIFLKVALVVPVLVFAAWFYRWIGWYYTVYIVTDQRILEIQQKGFFARRVNEWQLPTISSVNYEISGFQAVLFGFGDIAIKTYVGDFNMRTIHKPAEIHEQLVQAVKRGGGGGTIQSQRRDSGGSTGLAN